MSPSRSPRRRRGGGRRPRTVDLWQPMPELPRPEPIRAVADPTALVRSLGQPPLGNQSTVAQHYLSAVIERAAALAAALAATADLLAAGDEDDEEDEAQPA